MKLKLKISLALGAFVSLLVPGLASAHVGVTPTEAPAGGYALLEFSVPHGCDGAPTNKITVKMPPQVVSATPGVVADWNIRAKEGKLPQPVTQHGETVKTGVRQVIWSGGPLPDGQLQLFPMSVSFTDEEGAVAEFKVIQECTNGAKTAWIQSTPESGEEPESPAPSVTLGAPEADHHGASSEEGDDSEHSDMEHSEAASSDDSDDDSGDGLSIAALVVGALGLVAGGTALVKTRGSKN